MRGETTVDVNTFFLHFYIHILSNDHFLYVYNILGFDFLLTLVTEAPL